MIDGSLQFHEQQSAFWIATEFGGDFVQIASFAFEFAIGAAMIVGVGVHGLHFTVHAFPITAFAGSVAAGGESVIDQHA